LLSSQETKAPKRQSSIFDFLNPKKEQDKKTDHLEQVINKVIANCAQELTRMREMEFD
jgi:hypothetical protein